MMHFNIFIASMLEWWPYLYFKTMFCIYCIGQPQRCCSDINTPCSLIFGALVYYVLRCSLMLRNPSLSPQQATNYCTTDTVLGTGTHALQVAIVMCMMSFLSAGRWMGEIAFIIRRFRPFLPGNKAI